MRKLAMSRPYIKSLLISSIFTLLLINTNVSAQESSHENKWGFGLAANYSVPLQNLFDRYNGGPKIAFKWSYIKDDLIYEIEYFYSKFSSGKIEESKFQWNYDGNYYLSPDASSEMMFMGLIGNLKFPIKVNWSGISPFWGIGAGFTYYEQKIENLVFPGQSIPPLDVNFTYSPEKESNTALSANIGAGLQYFMTQQISFTLSFKYNILIANLRPMEAWYLEKVSPIQLLDVGFEFIYYFTQ